MTNRKNLLLCMNCTHLAPVEKATCDADGLCVIWNREILTAKEEGCSEHQNKYTGETVETWRSNHDE